MVRIAPYIFYKQTQNIFLTKIIKKHIGKPRLKNKGC